MRQNVESSTEKRRSSLKHGVLRAGAENDDWQTTPTNTATADGRPSPSSLFPTSKSSWSAERVSRYEYEITPTRDPKRTKKLLYMDRNREQTVAEIENGHELVRYLSNVAGLSKQSYDLLIRVQIDQQLQQQSCKERWDALLESFQLPSIIRVRVEFIDKGSNVERLFGIPEESTDWIFVVQDSTYVNLKRIVQRLFADIDPILATGKGLLYSVNGTMVPIAEAGILLTQKAVEEVWESPETRSCGETGTVTSIENWTVCLAKNSFVWTTLPGLNPYNAREIVRYALERSLFNTSLNKTYESVGGAIMGTARLPITYGNMVDDDLFYHQLAVETNQGKVPKIL